MAHRPVFFKALSWCGYRTLCGHSLQRQTDSRKKPRRRRIVIYFRYGFKVIFSLWFTNLFQIKVRAYWKPEAVTSIHVAARGWVVGWKNSSTDSKKNTDKYFRASTTRLHPGKVSLMAMLSISSWLTGTICEIWFRPRRQWQSQQPCTHLQWTFYSS